LQAKTNQKAPHDARSIDLKQYQLIWRSQRRLDSWIGRSIRSCQR